MVCFPINLWIRFDCTLHIETEVCYSHMHLYYYAWNRSEYRYSLVSIAYFTCIQRVQRSRIRKTASASLREWQKLENRKKNRNNRRCVSHVRGHWQHQFRIIEEQWQQQQQQIQHVANLQRSDCVMFGSSRSPFSHQQQQQQQARSMFVAHNTQHPISPVMFGFGFWLATLPVCIHYAGYQVKFNSYTTANNQHKHTAAKTYYRLFTAQLNIQQFRRAFALADYHCEIGRTSTRTGANTLTHTVRTEPTKVPLCPTSTISTLVDWGGVGRRGYLRCDFDSALPHYFRVFFAFAEFCRLFFLHLCFSAPNFSCEHFHVSHFRVCFPIATCFSLFVCFVCTASETVCHPVFLPTDRRIAFLFFRFSGRLVRLVHSYSVSTFFTRPMLLRVYVTTFWPSECLIAGEKNLQSPTNTHHHTVCYAVLAVIQEAAYPT